MRIKTVRISNQHAFEGEKILNASKTIELEETDHGVLITHGGGLKVELLPWGCVDRIVYEPQPATAPAKRPPVPEQHPAEVRAAFEAKAMAPVAKKARPE